MAFVVADRVQETGTVATGTGSVNLAGAVNAFQTFSSGIGNGNSTYYTIVDPTAYLWEVGVGTYSTSGNTLSRTTVLSNSSGNTSLISFSTSDTLTVFCTYPAEDAVIVDPNGNTYAPNIGGTTPSAGTFTTITGQTGNLTGGNSNFLTNSQLIGGGNWQNFGTATSTQNTAVAPDSTTTASTITGATGTTYSGNVIRQISIPVSGNTTYTFSCYIKTGTATTVSLGVRDNSTGTDTLVAFTPTSSWQRFSMQFTTGTTTPNVNVYFGNANGTFYAWGAQYNPGSSATTYLVTTSSAIYGYPSLSFNGNMGVEMDQSGNLILQPAGTGALQAQQTTSTSTGGNARGANAVDFQTTRNGASQVASGSNSVLVGGTVNTSSGAYSFLGGGGGNIASASYSFTGGGQNNNASGSYAVVSGGYGNTPAGYFNATLGGASNSATANASVTSQSATTNGTTTVTLSGLNASIKVGQFITGTYISFPTTYVAAISGTTLTLSQNATGSGSTTLYFYTPHGVVVGGGNNQATGSYSFVGGGGDAGIAGNRNTASGDWSFVGGGIGNVASGAYSAVVGGHNTASGNGSFVGGGGLNSSGLPTFANTASGLDSAVVGGEGNQATANWAISAGGFLNIANSNCSSIIGGSYGTTRSIEGNLVFPAQNQIFSSAGQIQSSLLILGVQTTDATPTVLRSNTAAASGTNQVILPNNSAYSFRATIIAGVTGGGNTASWVLQGAIKRGANASATSIVSAVTSILLAQDSGASTWAVSATADTTNGGLAITVTGQVSTTIRWVCKVETTEMTY